MKDYGYTPLQVAYEASLIAQLKIDKEEQSVRNMSLVEFLELISDTDFGFRYQKGDPLKRGIEARHNILRDHIKALSARISESEIEQAAYRRVIEYLREYTDIDRIDLDRVESQFIKGGE